MAAGKHSLDMKNRQTHGQTGMPKLNLVVLLIKNIYILYGLSHVFIELNLFFKEIGLKNHTNVGLIK